MKKLILVSFLLSFILTLSAENNKNDNSQVIGYYMVVDDYGNPQEINGLTIFYYLNPKGVILLGMGRSATRFSEAFSNPQEGIKSGAILVGTYEINDSEINITWTKSQKTATWYIKHGAMGDKIVMGNGYKLNYLGD